MLVMSSSGAFGRAQFGATPAEEAQVPRLTNAVSTLAQAETQLRTTFAKLIPDLTTLQVAGKDIPAPLLDLLQRYNAAVGSFMEASKIWLQARAQTPASDLPDPNSQAIAVPTFDLPAPSGFGWFGGVAASAIKVKHGIVGKEITTSLSGYMNSPFAGYFTGGQLGIEPLTTVVIAIILGLAIVGAVIIAVAVLTRTSDTAAANQAITEQVRERTREVISDRELFVSTRDSCIGNSPDQAVRLTCITAAKDVLKAAKEGRQQIQRPISPVVISTLGVLSVLAIAGGVGYVIYRKHQNGQSLPPARARSRSGARSGYDVDADNTYY
jgi:hypothetical protein